MINQRGIMEGQHLGDYQLIRYLGSGALGKTYLAQHRFLKKIFVVKILDQELANDAEFLTRFKQEAAILANLNHPNIVKVHNITESEGYHYLVTDPVIDEHGESTNLYHYIEQKNGILSEEEVFKISHQIAAALDYSHGQKESFEPIAHFSLKPSNILIQKKDDLTIQITDFRLSKVIGPMNYMPRIYQILSEKIGTAPQKIPSKELAFIHHYLFLAPEQKWNYEQVSGVKCDTYTFGALLYFILTGRYPEGIFDSQTISKNYKLPWGKIIIKCLHIEAEERPLSLAALLEDLLLVQEVEKKIEAQLNLKPFLKPMELQRPEFEPNPEAIFQTEMFVGRYEPKVEEKPLSPPILTEMSIIEGGSFERGSHRGGRDEIPRHSIILDSFAIDIHPVTNEQFVQFLDALGGEKDHNNNDIIRLKESRIKRSVGKLIIESGYVRHPVVGVTYYGAIAYAKWAGKRLPTEAEWEVSSYGGKKECMYPTGKDIDRSHANFFSSDTTPVMSYPPNAYGLYDLAGNVYEWCTDWYDYHYYNVSLQEPRNPKGPFQGVYRVLRGGCWKSLKEDLRCAHRHRNNPNTVNGTYGFRCAADVVAH